MQLFWQTRNKQARKRGKKKDQGARGAVTGGAQLDGFVDLVCAAARAAGLPEASIHRKTRVELPGYFRPTKKWDVVLVHDRKLIAAIEFKSQVGSLGNNQNNRAEEAVGNATDLWTAFREGAFDSSSRPWLAYVLIVEDSPESTRGVEVKEPHSPVFPEFRGASYETRYRVLCERLLRERLYDCTVLLLASKARFAEGDYREPSSQHTFRQFEKALRARIQAATIG